MTNLRYIFLMIKFCNDESVLTRDYLHLHWVLNTKTAITQVIIANLNHSPYMGEAASQWTSAAVYDDKPQH